MVILWIDNTTEDGKLEMSKHIVKMIILLQMNVYYFKMVFISNIHSDNTLYRYNYFSWDNCKNRNINGNMHIIISDGQCPK